MAGWYSETLSEALPLLAFGQIDGFPLARLQAPGVEPLDRAWQWLLDRLLPARLCCFNATKSCRIALIFAINDFKAPEGALLRV